MVIALMDNFANLHMEVMNFDRTIRQISDTKPKSVNLFSMTITVIMEIGATLSIMKNNNRRTMISNGD